jgi:hypothetical protein
MATIARISHTVLPHVWKWQDSTMRSKRWAICTVSTARRKGVLRLINPAYQGHQTEDNAPRPIPC